jgi:hypothetical protein
MLPDTILDRTFFLGVDLGQRQDPSAVVIVERTRVEYGDRDLAYYARRKEYRLAVRYVEPFPLETPYEDVVQQIGHLVRSGELRRNCQTVVDATGVGIPVLEMMRRANYTCPIVPVMIGSGLTASRDATGVWHVPKPELVTRLQLLLQGRRLQFSATMPHIDRLVRELENFQMKITGTGKTKFEAAGQQEHDDVVMALTLACWRATWHQEWA